MTVSCRAGYNNDNYPSFTLKEVSDFMNIRLITRTVGYILWVEGGFMLLPLLISLGYGDGCWEAFLSSALLLWRLEPAQGVRRGAHCAALVFATALMAALCQLTGDIAPVWLLFCIAVGGGMALYHTVLRRRARGGALWYLAAILLGVAYLLLTARPLTWGIFLDPRDAAAMAAIPF